MYQSQVRPAADGRELVAQQQPKQHSSSPRNLRRKIQIFLPSSSFQTRVFCTVALAFGTGALIAALSGCGVNYRELNTISGTSKSTGSGLSEISCGTQSLTGSQTKGCSVYLSAAASSPTNVKLSSSNAALQVPATVTVQPGAQSTGFDAISSAVTKAVSVTITGSEGGVTKTDVITLYPGTTSSASLTKISCGTQTLTGPTTKACSVYLSAAAESAVKVSLSSSSGSLRVPATVTVAAGSSTAGFNAAASAVSATQSVMLTATANGVSQTDAIQLDASGTQPPPAASLSKISCATQTLTGPTATACSVSLSTAAANAVQVSLSSSNSSLQVPATVTVPSGSTTGGFTATASAVTTTEKVTLTASSNGVSQTDQLQLDASGTQPPTTTQHKVQLDWNAPNSTVAIVGYRVYRAQSGSSYQLLNSTVDASTSYTDSSVASGLTYDYIVKSVDSEGVESAPSNETTVAVP